MHVNQRRPFMVSNKARNTGMIDYITFCVRKNFYRSSVDPCLYIKSSSYLLIWVDDLIIISNNKQDNTEIKKHLSLEFEMKDLTNNTNKNVF